MGNLHIIKSYIDPYQKVLYDVHGCFEQCVERGIGKKSIKNHLYDNNDFYLFVISLAGGLRKKIYVD